MSLPTLLGIPVLSEDRLTYIDNALFPDRFAWDCVNRRRQLEIRRGNASHTESGFKGTTKLRGPVPNGEAILAELLQIRGLLVARISSLEDLREHIKKKGDARRYISTASLYSTRDIFNTKGWPGHLRDLESFNSSDTQSAIIPSESEADALHEVHAETIGVTWDAMRAAFFPGVSDDDWKLTCADVKKRHRWPGKGFNKLGLGSEQAQLGQSASGREGSQWSSPVGADTNKTPLGSPDRNAMNSAPRQHGNYQPVVTDDILYKKTGYYPSDAYNIVRLRSHGLTFEAISELALKGRTLPRE